MKPRPKPLSLLSLNVNGLNSRDKRASLFFLLKRRRYDVVLLQETHHETEEVGLGWAKEMVGAERAWPGESFWSHGTHQARGVAILVREGSPITEPTLLHSGTDGRICAISIIYLGKKFSLFNVYAPSGSDVLQKRDFFCNALLPCLPAHRQRLLIGGDFNCVESGLDCSSGLGGSRLGGFEGGLQEVVQECDLVDIWRLQQGTRKGFTHTCTTGLSNARLDRWYVSEDLPQWVDAPRRPVLGLPGDHLGVRLELRAPSPSPRGPGAWTLPLSLLCSDEYKEDIRNLIQAALSQPLAEAQPHCTRYIAIKNKIYVQSRLWSTKHAQREAAGRRALESRAEAALARCEASPTCLTALAEFQEEHADLQACLRERAAGAALRAGLVNQHYGERSTHWFYQQAQIREAQTSFPAIRASTAEPALPLDTPAACSIACEVVADYFAGDRPHGLYSLRPTSVPAQQELLASVDCVLTQDAREGAEGPNEGLVGLEELTQALTSSDRGRVPGLDGLPYEFYLEFWDLLGPLLVALLEEVFQDPEARLPADLTKGRISLLHKPGKDRTLPESYRPITLLNVDYKLLAKAVSRRLGPALNTVVDDTQTAFLPERWIGDNVSAHLEEMDYLREVGEPGVIVFLDFEKAFDRVDRAWLGLCLSRLGFGPHMQRWVMLLHANTSARITVNGYFTRTFPILSGVFQGSPLSPLLYVASTQPMSAHARALSRRGGVEAISMPDGRPAPLMHLHADDTSLHTRTLAGLEQLMATTLHLHCQATSARLQPAKCQGLQLGVPIPFSGIHAPTSVPFVGPGQSIKHLGILHGHDGSGEAGHMYEGLLKRMRSRVGVWCQRNLSQVGRVHVAKQVLVSMLTYLAGFIPPPPAHLSQLLALVHTFIASNRLADPSEAVRCSLYPRRAVCMLPEKAGGLGMPNILAHINSLQAKLVSRWLEPERLTWKCFFDQWLLRSKDWMDAHPGVPMRRHDRWGLGRFLPFSTYSLDRLQVPGRIKEYLRAHASLQSHRLSPSSQLLLPDCLTERLFYNRQITDGAGKALAGREWQPWAEAGVVSLWGLRQHRQLGRPALPGWEVLHASLPAHFQAALTQPVHFQWYLQPSSEASALQTVVQCTEGQAMVFRIEPSGRLSEQVPQPEVAPVLQSSWMPAVVLPWG